MSNKKIKIVELNVVERMQLAYCADVTFQYYTEKSYTATIATLEFIQYESFSKLITDVKAKIKEHAKNDRADNFMNLRMKNGWIV